MSATRAIFMAKGCFCKFYKLCICVKEWGGINVHCMCPGFSHVT